MARPEFRFGQVYKWMGNDWLQVMVLSHEDNKSWFCGIVVRAEPGHRLTHNLWDVRNDWIASNSWVLKEEEGK